MIETWYRAHLGGGNTRSAKGYGVPKSVTYKQLVVWF